ncbi:alpha-mannosidase [Curtobacterium sp. Leaf261]|uniref:alpha-mannosidase n=1 Tax=Curtobacterium sp. Leaf261 TaxID=1736311 RepID=UPI0006F9ACB0|nr:glycoside hydrolase family 38 C-terminal domain-containing protein [Curtobacterium sp. Leaf261]KQO64756.1 alpha-mannosidase [Curtobacterium sp. Leaf261]
MHADPALVEGRVRRVLVERIVPAVHEVVGGLEVTAWHVGDDAVGEDRAEPVSPRTALPGLDPDAAAAAGVDYRPFAVGTPWGPAWSTTWFHLTGTIPDVVTAATGTDTVEAVVDLGWNGVQSGMQAEGLVYRPDGTAVKALNPFNAWIPLDATPGASVDLYVEAAANPNFFEGPRNFQRSVQGDRATSTDVPLARLVRADVTVRHHALAELAADVEFLVDLQATLDLGDPRRWNVLGALERSMDALDLGDVVGSADRARAELVEVLAQPAVPSAHTVTAIGHAHIDSAWLWPVRETIRKVARTTSNVVDLLDREPDLHFAMSSAQQYAWLKEHRPEVWDRVRTAVAGGRLIPVGGMWVESDTNMVGSEAMVRQFTHGQRFFREEFGITAREAWLPDTFGYSAALPQIVRLVGIRWFLTQKISWNRTNDFPHHSFRWEGIDGTRVFTHFPPADTYNGTLSAEELTRSVRKFRDKGSSNHSLLPFGWGDGGGGPTREMLQRAARSADLEGAPKVVVRSPRAFFEEAEAEYTDAPVWKGELYLELHRGTLTSQADVKRGNRHSERLLHEAETWAAAAAVRGLRDYPYELLDAQWKTLLLHQFHDMLPGTGIAWVHQETRRRHAEIARVLDEVIRASLAALVGDGTVALTANASPSARRGIGAGGVAVTVPSPAAATIGREARGHVLENAHVRLVVADDGTFVSVQDAAGRETIPPGARGNLLQVHQDLPVEWDAWDVDEYYRNTVVDVDATESLETVTLDDGRPALRIRRTFGADGASSVVQEVALAPDAPRVDIRTSVDWHEREHILKLAFPIDVHSDTAAFETQFGHLVRPTHENTSWDAARFEVVAHRWVHVGEAGWGAAVLNDGSYGHDVTRHEHPHGGTFTTVRQSLLRGPVFPDPETDQGAHEFHGALLIGAGIDDAVRHGYDLGIPERSLHGDHAVAPLVAIDGRVVLETTKLADDASGDLVLRLYEPNGARASATITLDVPIDGVHEVDLLEDPLDGTALVEGDGAEPIRLQLRPFQIVTLRMTTRRTR